MSSGVEIAFSTSCVTPYIFYLHPPPLPQNPQPSGKGKILTLKFLAVATFEVSIWGV